MKIKQSVKKLLIAILAIIMTSNFILPNYSHAIDAKLGKPFAAFITFFGDAVENGLQQFFVGSKAIYEYTEDDGWFGTELFGTTTIKANMQYSVANIVANNIPIFDINFFGEGNSIICRNINPLSYIASGIADMFYVIFDTFAEVVNTTAETYGINSQEMKEVEENIKKFAEENGEQDVSSITYDKFMISDQYYTQEYKDAMNNRRYFSKSKSI